MIYTYNIIQFIAIYKIGMYSLYMILGYRKVYNVPGA